MGGRDATLNATSEELIYVTIMACTHCSTGLLIALSDVHTDSHR